jgi:hypothetical protein
MTRMISRDYHFRYHSAYYIVYHRFLPKTYSKLFSVEGCSFCCCCFQCNFPYLIVGIRAWFAGYPSFHNKQKLLHSQCYIISRTNYQTVFKFFHVSFEGSLKRNIYIYQSGMNNVSADNFDQHPKPI